MLLRMVLRGGVKCNGRMKAEGWRLLFPPIPSGNEMLFYRLQVSGMPQADTARVLHGRVYSVRDIALVA
jgi:hypothetical protein